jgi:hypothetical protein
MWMMGADMSKAPSAWKVGTGILGFCLCVRFASTHPASAIEASPAPAPPQYQGMVPDTGHRGVIDDPDGFVNLRSEERADSPVIAKVKTGEVFFFEHPEGSGDWCKVKVATGKTGWMHYSRIRLFYTKDDLPPRSDEDDDIEKQTRRKGVDYYQITQGAVRGDPESCKKFFSIAEYCDGIGAEEHWGVFKVVIHLIGDEALARFFRTQPVAFRKSVGDSLPFEATYPFDPREYLERHFPRTARVLLLQLDKQG